MRIIQRLVMAAAFLAASWVQADTLRITVKDPLSATQAREGAQALRALPQAGEVYVNAHRRIYAVELRDEQPITDVVLGERLAQAGQSVIQVKRTTSSFKSVKARLKRSPHRYSKWN